MRLKAVKLKNFRAYVGEFCLPVGSMTAIVGRNDAGKSSIFDALDIFFNDAKPDDGDFSVFASDQELRIGCVFSDLPNELTLDTASKTTLAGEYLLNADGDLEVHRVYRRENERLKEKGFFANALHPSKPDGDSLLLRKIAELKKIAAGKEIDLKNIDLRFSPPIRAAIWSAERDLVKELTEIPLNKEDAKAIWEGLAKELPAFAIFRADRPSTDEDAEVQDPMKLAVKAALKEVEGELEAIKSKVTTKALDVANRTLAKLQEIDPHLASALNPTLKAEPKWDSLFKLSLTADDQIPVNKRGSGVRRLLLFSFFKAEADRRREETQHAGIIYAVEEPETAQHPENQRLLVEALQDIAITPESQVLITTHVPGLAGLIGVDDLRYIRKGTGASGPTLAQADDQTLSDIAHELGVLPDPRIAVIVCVEGKKDIAFLENIAAILHSVDPSLPDLKNSERIAIVPVGGSNLKHWVTRHCLKQLQVPEIHIYDSDQEQSYKPACDEVNKRDDGSKAFLTKKREMENYLHPEAIAGATGLVIEVTDTNDVPLEFARIVHETASEKPWEELTVEKKKDKENRGKRTLNEAVASKMTVTMLEQRGGKAEIVGWLREIQLRLAGGSAVQQASDLVAHGA